MSRNQSTVVRLAHARDIGFLLKCNQAMADETEDKGLNPETLEKGITYLLAHPKEGLYLVAECNGHACGSLMLTFEWSDWRNGRFWWIQSVYVLPSMRRRGVYTALHTESIRLAKQDTQACGIRLYVEKENINAQQTYYSLGMYETHYQLFEQLF